MTERMTTGLLYVILYKKMVAAVQPGNPKTLLMRDVRSVMARPLGLDHDRVEKIVNEMEAWGFVSKNGRDKVVLNDVVVPDV